MASATEVAWVVRGDDYVMVDTTGVGEATVSTDEADV
jgi:hypothetical protein